MWVYYASGTVAWFSIVPSFIAWLGLWPEKQEQIEQLADRQLLAGYLLLFVALLGTLAVG